MQFWVARSNMSANGRPDRAQPKAGVVWAVLCVVFF